MTNINIATISEQKGEVYMITIKDILDKPEAIYNGDSSKITFYTVTVIEKTGKQLFIKTAQLSNVLMFLEHQNKNCELITFAAERSSLGDETFDINLTFAETRDAFLKHISKRSVLPLELSNSIINYSHEYCNHLSCKKCPLHVHSSVSDCALMVVNEHLMSQAKEDAYDV
jgi:hypothetical protein